MHARCDDQPTRRQILANLIDEEAGDPNHPQLWKNFAAALGVSPNDLDETKAWPETAELIATFRAVCREGEIAEGLAALYAYESQIPAVSESKIDGLVRALQIRRPGRAIATSPSTSKPTANTPRPSARSSRAHASGKFRRGHEGRRPDPGRALGTALRGLPPPRHRMLMVDASLCEAREASVVRQGNRVAHATPRSAPSQRNSCPLLPPNPVKKGDGIYNLVVIGAGTAGLVTAAGSVALGARVALIERNQMGGDCLNFGCVPSKALISSARLLASHAARREMGPGEGRAGFRFPKSLRQHARAAGRAGAARFGRNASSR